MTSSLSRLIEISARRHDIAPGEIGADDDIFDRLGIDSYQAAELMSDLEMEFDVEIPDYELQEVKTFGQLAQAIDRRR